MSHRDLKGCVRLNSCDLRLALSWLLRGIDWSPIKLREDCTWTASLLATTALLSPCCDELTLIDRFVAVRRIVLHLFPQTWEVANTYQGFTKILRRRTTELVGLLQRTLRERMQRDRRVAGWCWVSSCSGSTGAGPNCLGHDLTNRRIPRLVGSAAPAKAADARELPRATGRSRIVHSCG